MCRTKSEDESDVKMEEIQQSSSSKTVKITENMSDSESEDEEDFLDPEVVALVRIVVARSLEDADFARTFHERTATRTRDSLRNLFARWKADGTAMAGTPDMLADA